jgi:hypothetical protein
MFSNLNMKLSTPASHAIRALNSKFQFSHNVTAQLSKILPKLCTMYISAFEVRITCTVESERRTADLVWCSGLQPGGGGARSTSDGSSLRVDSVTHSNPFLKCDMSQKTNLHAALYVPKTHSLKFFY